MDDQEKIKQHREQMRKDGYLDYPCGDCGKTIWRRNFEDWRYCENCTNAQTKERQTTN